MSENVEFSHRRIKVLIKEEKKGKKDERVDEVLSALGNDG